MSGLSTGCLQALMSGMSPTYPIYLQVAGGFPRHLRVPLAELCQHALCNTCVLFSV